MTDPEIAALIERLALARIEWEEGEYEPQISSLDYLGADDRRYWLKTARAAYAALLTASNPKEKPDV